MKPIIKINSIEPSDQLVWETMVMDYDDGLYDQLKPSWDKLFAQDSAVQGMIATIGSAPVGFMHFTRHEFCFGKAPVCYLADLYVKPEFRRQGVARAMLEWLLAQAKKEKLGRVYWVTDPDNPARTLYDEYGISGYIRYSVDLIEGM